MVATTFLASLSGGGLQSFTFGIFVKPMSESLGWSRTVITGALAIRTYSGAMVAPIFGTLVDRYGPRGLMLLMAIVGGVACLLLSKVTQPWHFYAIFATIGLSGGTGAGTVVGEATVNKWFVRLRGRAIAFATMGNVAAGIILAPFVGFVIETQGWQSAWLIIAGLFFFLLLPFSTITARKPEDMGLFPDGAKNERDFLESSQKRSFQESFHSWTLKQAFATKSLWILLLAQVCAGFPGSSVVIHHFSYITDEGFSNAMGAAVMSTFAFSAMLARVTWGLLVERYPVRYCMALSYFGNVLGLTFLLIGIHFSFSPMLFLFAIVYGLSIGGSVVLTSVAIANYFGREFVGAIRGAVMAIVTSSTALGPLLTSIAYDSQGTYFGAFIVMIALFLLSSFSVLFAKPPQHKNPIEPANNVSLPYE